MEQAPFITRFAERRRPEEPLPGCYDEETAVTVVRTTTGLEPLVGAAKGLPELLTKTEVERESDEGGWGFMRELYTKTKIERESDD